MQEGLRSHSLHRNSSRLQGTRRGALPLLQADRCRCQQWPEEETHPVMRKPVIVGEADETENGFLQSF